MYEMPNDHGPGLSDEQAPNSVEPPVGNDVNGVELNLFDPPEAIKKSSDLFSLESDLDAAVGPNRAVLEIFQHSDELERIGCINLFRIETSRSGELTSHVWSVGFRAGSGEDPDVNDFVPLTELPSLMIDGDEIQVDNVSIVMARILEDNAWSGTEIIINARPRPQENIFGTSLDTRIININADGKMIFGRGDPSYRPRGTLSIDPTYSYTQETPESNVTSFVEGISAAVSNTAAAYATVGELGGKGLP